MTDFKNGQELLEVCKKKRCPISEVMKQREIEGTSSTKKEVEDKMQKALAIMKESVRKPLEDPKLFENLCAVLAVDDQRDRLRKIQTKNAHDGFGVYRIAPGNKICIEWIAGNKLYKGFNAFNGIEPEGYFMHDGNHPFFVRSLSASSSSLSDCLFVFVIK